MNETKRQLDINLLQTEELKKNTVVKMDTVLIWYPQDING